MNNPSKKHPLALTGYIHNCLDEDLRVIIDPSRAVSSAPVFTSVGRIPMPGEFDPPEQVIGSLNTIFTLQAPVAPLSMDELVTDLRIPSAIERHKNDPLPTYYIVTRTVVVAAMQQTPWLVAHLVIPAAPVYSEDGQFLGVQRFALADQMQLC